MSTSPPYVEVPAGSVRNVAVDMRGLLDSGETMVSVDAPTEVGGSDLAFSAEKVNTGAITVRGRSVPIGMAIQFSASGFVAGTDHEVEMKATSSATPAQTLVARITLRGT